MVATPDANRLAELTLGQQHPLTREWCDAEERRRRLAEALAFDVRLATDLELAAQRGRRFAPQQPAALFLDRWLVIGDGLEAQLSMRYEGGDPALPFVQVTASTRPPDADPAADLAGYVHAARSCFGVLSPRYLRLWSSQPNGSIAGTGPDRRFLAAPLAELRARDLPAGVSSRPTADLAHYPDLMAAYAAVDAEHQDHPRQAKPASRESLAESIEAGLLFDVLVDGSWAGYVGGLTDVDSLGLPGYTVEELVLDTAHRGRGLGSALSVLLARALPTDGADGADGAGVLIGTIHHDNRGARTAALRAGRLDVGGWVTVPP